MMRYFVLFTMFCAPLPAVSHPHVLVETTLHIIVGADAQMQAIEITWSYDELYSLLVFEDMELDPDYDGVLTQAELAKLNGFDMNWVPGFEGDVFAFNAGQPLALGPAIPLQTSVKEGRIETRHRRVLSGPAAGLQLQAYDPGYYTAYSLAGGVTVSGPCTAQIIPADLNAAYARLDELLYAMPQEQAEIDFPQVGADFADLVKISCVGSSE